MTHQDWHEHNKKWKASGKRQDIYCKEAGISIYTFQYIGTKVRKLENETGFKKIELPNKFSNKKFLELGITSEGNIYVNLNLELVL